MTAERAGSRVIFFSPAKVSFDSRGRVAICTPGNNRSISARAVAGPDQHGFTAPAPVQPPLP